MKLAAILAAALCLCIGLALRKPCPPCHEPSAEHPHETFGNDWDGTFDPDWDWASDPYTAGLTGRTDA